MKWVQGIFHPRGFFFENPTTFAPHENTRRTLRARALVIRVGAAPPEVVVFS